MKLTFLGGAGTTTGSMHLLEINRTRILLECGLFQGNRKEAFERNRNLPVDAASLHVALLSHAHIDHAGNLPNLVRRGFRGDILATPATLDLCDIMLRDSAHLQEKDVEFVNRKRLAQGKRPFEPLYGMEDVDLTMEHLRPKPYGETFAVGPGVTATFRDAGHLLGSALVVIDATENGTTRRLLFTGDLGRPDMPILRNPEVVSGVDVLLTESTYGDRIHPPKADVAGRLKGFIEDIHAQRARLIIPSFSVGRTQEIVLLLNEIYRQGRIPVVPVFVDSPLSSKATAVYRAHPECYDAETLRIVVDGREPFQFEALTYVTELEESKRLNDRPGPAVIVSASGMCEGGRILHHLAHGVGSPRNIVLFVGYQAENTLGRRLVEHQSPVRIFGDAYDVQARIHTINALSAHADRHEMVQYFTAAGASRMTHAFVVHGEDKPRQALAGELRRMGVGQVVVPLEPQTHTV